MLSTADDCDLPHALQGHDFSSQRQLIFGILGTLGRILIPQPQEGLEGTLKKAKCGTHVLSTPFQSVPMMVEMNKSLEKLMSRYCHQMT